MNSESKRGRTRRPQKRQRSPTKQVKRPSDANGDFKVINLNIKDVLKNQVTNSLHLKTKEPSLNLKMF